jgi:hypothetical protein
MTEFTGTPPKGSDLLATLITLLEQQEGVKITYEIERK